MKTTRSLLIVSLIVLASGAMPARGAEPSVQNRREYQSAGGGIPLFGAMPGTPAATPAGSPVIAGGPGLTVSAAPPVAPSPPQPNERNNYNSATGGVIITLGLPTIGSGANAPKVPPPPSARREFNGLP